MSDAIANPARRNRGWRSVSTQRAFLTHLAMSASIVGAVCGLIFFVWYPAPYFQAKGAWNVLRVLIGVDLILGPLLTLILFRPNKPGLGLDMAMIAMIQLSALLYGTTVIFQERPYYAVFAVDRFEILTKRDVDGAAVAGTAFADKPLIGPVLAVATRPADPVEFQRLLEETLFEGKPDIERRPERWQPFEKARDAVLSRAQPLSALLAIQPAAADAIERVARELGKDPSGIVYVPVVASERAWALVIDPETAAPRAVLDVNPWSS